MPTTAAELVSFAKSQVENLTPDQVAIEIGRDALLIDVREPAELDAEGMIRGAVHAPRGMLEFWADLASPDHRPEFDPQRRTVVYCATGGRSALAAQLLRQLGYADVAHLDGGITAWKQVGHPVVNPREA
ncbi:MAG: rhodanese-like domain-containing protein [Actinomycetota bacterium]|nr:rhodanese-like domain-containing protein [Actinomycetota bacterium]